MLGQNRQAGESFGAAFQLNRVAQKAIDLIRRQPQGFIARNLPAIVGVDRGLGNVGAVDVQASVGINPAGGAVKG